MNIKRTLSVVLCFLLVCGFSLEFLVYAQRTQRDGPFVSLGNMTQEEPSPLCHINEPISRGGIAVLIYNALDVVINR